MEAIEVEFSRAASARVKGNEGQARVCSRRAAGIAIREFLLYHHHPVLSPSATDLLRWVQSQPDLPEEARTAASHLLMRVMPDFKLPVDADLVEEARRLIAILAEANDGIMD